MVGVSSSGPSQASHANVPPAGSPWSVAGTPLAAGSLFDLLAPGLSPELQASFADLLQSLGSNSSVSGENPLASLTGSAFDPTAFGSNGSIATVERSLQEWLSLLQQAAGPQSVVSANAPTGIADDSSALSTGIATADQTIPASLLAAILAAWNAAPATLTAGVPTSPLVTTADSRGRGLESLADTSADRFSTTTAATSIAARLFAGSEASTSALNSFHNRTQANGSAAGARTFDPAFSAAATATAGVAPSSLVPGTAQPPQPFNGSTSGSSPIAGGPASTDLSPQAGATNGIGAGSLASQAAVTATTNASNEALATAATRRTGGNLATTNSAASASDSGSSFATTAASRQASSPTSSASVASSAGSTAAQAAASRIAAPGSPLAGGGFANKDSSVTAIGSAATGPDNRNAGAGSSAGSSADDFQVPTAGAARQSVVSAAAESGSRQADANRAAGLAVQQPAASDSSGRAAEFNARISAALTPSNAGAFDLASADVINRGPTIAPLDAVASELTVATSRTEQLAATLGRVTAPAESNASNSTAAGGVTPTSASSQSVEINDREQSGVEQSLNSASASNPDDRANNGAGGRGSDQRASARFDSALLTPASRQTFAGFIRFLANRTSILGGSASLSSWGAANSSGAGLAQRAVSPASGNSITNSAVGAISGVTASPATLASSVSALVSSLATTSPGSFPITGTAAANGLGPAGSTSGQLIGSGNRSAAAVPPNTSTSVAAIAWQQTWTFSAAGRGAAAADDSSLGRGQVDGGMSRGDELSNGGATSVIGGASSNDSTESDTESSGRGSSSDRDDDRLTGGAIGGLVSEAQSNTLSVGTGSSRSSAGSFTSALAGAQSTAGFGSTAANLQPLTQQVLNGLDRAAKQQSVLSFELNPPALGRVRLEVAESSGRIRARIETETSEARKRLSENVGELATALSAAGQRIDSLEILELSAGQFDQRGQQATADELANAAANNSSNNQQSDRRESAANSNPISSEPRLRVEGAHLAEELASAQSRSTSSGASAANHGRPLPRTELNIRV